MYNSVYSVLECEITMNIECEYRQEQEKLEDETAQEDIGMMEEMRRELNLIGNTAKKLTDKVVVDASQRLDVLIVQYYIKKNIVH